jgi:hypothetical protein
MVAVAHIRQLKPGWQSNPRFVYIGRPGYGQEGYFGNPIRLLRESEREQVLKQYAEYFFARLESDLEFQQRLDQIPSDAVLVCFCAPRACHGDVISMYLNQKES